MTATRDDVWDDEHEQELRRLARQLLDAEAAYRRSPTMHVSYRLERVRRCLEDVLAGEP